MCRPVFYLAIILASLLSSTNPEWTSAFIFDRHALLGGEIWRILTGHFVHFSYIHLLYNLSAFGIVGYMIEKKNYSNLYLLYFFMSLCTSISLLIFKPGMAYYGGLSGIVYGFLYYCALMGINDAQPWKTVSFLILFFLPIKMVVDTQINAPGLFHVESQIFTPMQTSHITGCLVAAFFYFIEKRKQALTNHSKNTHSHDNLSSPPAPTK
ncbi:rhombosortase [Microbulbifer spongiae]|uniref:Rhombosortase n=1 Tax=Microbulbifer spongiae TaxID=2944933 RepID=A0ABY9EBA6_9GAMM|nr:rhombosortase [Microbulbifer sp. MI-G]WKD49383.1 rhombosortase [Microbulbifer sp. MI-G]